MNLGAEPRSLSLSGGGGAGKRPAAARSVDTDHLNMCAVVDDGPTTVVRCLGVNAAGQLGDGSTRESFAEAVTVRGLANVEQVAVGWEFACARLSSRRVACWGRNDLFQLGNDTLSSSCRVHSRGDAREVDVPCSLTPVDVAGLADVAQVACGGAHACARLVDGTVWCWGSNNHGQLGDGSYDDRPSPVKVLVDAADIALSGTQSCATLRDATLRCWGSWNRAAPPEPTPVVIRH
jgi:alpha-tubulin suppressor-like RCC1 family protein